MADPSRQPEFRYEVVRGEALVYGADQFTNLVWDEFGWEIQ